MSNRQPTAISIRGDYVMIYTNEGVTMDYLLRQTQDAFPGRPHKEILVEVLEGERLMLTPLVPGSYRTLR